MTEVQFLDLDQLLFLHRESLALFGGAPGIRDAGIAESALNRPRNMMAYGVGHPDLFDLAAAMGWAICNNHAFTDGNKRTAFAAMGLFLLENEFFLDSSEREAEAFMKHVAGEGGDHAAEEELAAWLRSNSIPLPNGIV